MNFTKNLAFKHLCMVAGNTSNFFYFSSWNYFTFTPGTQENIFPIIPLSLGTVSLRSSDGMWVEVIYTTSSPGHKSPYAIFLNFPPNHIAGKEGFWDGGTHNGNILILSRLLLRGAAQEISWLGTLALNLIRARILYYCIKLLRYWDCLSQVNVM